MIKAHQKVLPLWNDRHLDVTSSSVAILQLAYQKLAPEARVSKEMLLVIEGLLLHCLMLY